MKQNYWCIHFTEVMINGNGRPKTTFVDSKKCVETTTTQFNIENQILLHTIWYLDGDFSLASSLLNWNKRHHFVVAGGQEGTNVCSFQSLRY